MPKLRPNPLSKNSDDRMERSYYRSLGMKTPVSRGYRRQKKLIKKLESIGHSYKTCGRMESLWKRRFLACFEEPTHAVGYY